MMTPKLLVRFSLGLILLVAAGWPAGRVQAAGVVGNGTPESCTDLAFTAALQGGGLVTFNCGGPATVLLLSEKTVTHDTILDGGGVITLTGGLATRLLTAAIVGGVGAALELRNITLDRGFSDNGSGGALRAYGPLTMTNVTIKDSVAGLNFCGGAVYVVGEALITGSTFRNNIAALGGGAICVRTVPTLTVQVRGSTFFNNHSSDASSGFGGALYVAPTTRVSVSDSLFFGNGANYGGAAYVGPNAMLTLQGTTSAGVGASEMHLFSNTALENGGALYNEGTLMVNTTLIIGNQTAKGTVHSGFGGGIYSQGVLTLTHSELRHNVSRHGGGLFVGNNDSGAQAAIDDTTFIANTSLVLGGGLYTNFTATHLQITNSNFDGNSSQDGGGLARFNAALSVLNTSFIDNTAGRGGGLFLGAGPFPTSGPYVRVENTTLHGNSASAGMGGGVFNFGQAELYSLTFVDNSSGVYGAASGNTRFRNTVLWNPGGPNCHGDGSATVSDDGANYAADATCALPSSQTGNGLDPQLSEVSLDPIKNTFYHIPLAGSPLINAGANCLPHDQLGAARVGNCDIGAVEFGGMRPRVYLPVIVQ